MVSIVARSSFHGSRGDLTGGTYRSLVATATEFISASKCWQGLLSLLDNLNIFHRKANATLWNSV